MNIKIILGIVFAGIVSLAALADESTPLFYSRSDIAIVRRTPVALPWLPPVPDAHNAAPRRVIFGVEVRDATTLYNQKGWFNLSSPSDNGGVLMLFAAPGIAPIVPAAQYAPLDILMIDSEGTITQIVPNVTLSELQQEITPASPVMAFLFLKGGACKKFSIEPGDSVDYPRFKKPPAVLSIVPPVPATRDITPPGTGQ
ncbi:MAG: DUF192 domain-containing protein [Pseudomonadota bacterium]|nr:DUF192 domain-containing protein [Pseudomonadota bacterium]MDE3036921.1 DUF192 domain-containing protein [Pseudomonadota bacterium]